MIERLQCCCKLVLPLVYDDTLSLYELACKIVQKVNEMIENNNAMKTLIEEFINQFSTNLEQTVTEILNEWKADGTLEDIVDNIFANSVKEYGTLQQLKQRTDLTSGDLVKTTGYRTQMDFGEGTYIIAPATGYTPNEGSIVALQNNLVAILYMPNNTSNFNQWGAYGNGINDDTSAVQNCINNSKIAEGVAGLTYIVSSTIVIPYGTSVDGKTCEIMSSQNFVTTARGNLPSYVIVWVTSRSDTTYGDEFRGRTQFVKNLRITDYGTATNSVGLYLGHYGEYQTSQTSTVNYSVMWYKFNNISIANSAYGIDMAECWECDFSDIHIQIRQTGIFYFGQCVNNRWVNIEIKQADNALSNARGIYSTIADFEPIKTESQGNSFSNLGIYSFNSHSVEINQGSTFFFTNCFFDLCTDVSVLYHNQAYENKMINCYLQSTSACLGVGLSSETTNPNTRNSFINCEFIRGSNTSYCVAVHNGINTMFIGCTFHQMLSVDTNMIVLCNDCQFFTNPYYTGSGYITGINNVLAGDGSVLAPSNNLPLYTNTNDSALFLYQRLFNNTSPVTVYPNIVSNVLLIQYTNQTYEYSADATNNPQTGNFGVAHMFHHGALTGVIAFSNSGNVYSNFYSGSGAWLGWKQLNN